MERKRELETADIKEKLETPEQIFELLYRWKNVKSGIKIIFAPCYVDIKVGDK